MYTNKLNSNRQIYVARIVLYRTCCMRFTWPNSSKTSAADCYSFRDLDK